MNRQTRRAEASKETAARRQRNKHSSKEHSRKPRWMPDWLRNLFDIF